MSKSLKQKNQPQIITLLLINAVVLSTVAIGWNIVAAVIQASHGNLGILGKILAAPAILSVLVGVVSWSLPKGIKEAVVFWRIGVSCLPSSRAFTVIAASDPRVNLEILKERIGVLPVDPAKQTSVWYAMYRRYTSDISVEDAHGAYLRYREMTALTVVMFGLWIPAALWLGVVWNRSAISLLVLVIEYAVLALCARNAAISLVKNVLAIASAKVESVV